MQNNDPAAPHKNKHTSNFSTPCHPPLTEAHLRGKGKGRKKPVESELTCRRARCLGEPDGLKQTVNMNTAVADITHDMT